MRIAFDTTPMPAKRAGAGVYTYHLARTLAANEERGPLLLVDRHGAFDDLDGQNGVTVRRVQASGRGQRILWEQTGLPGVVRDWGADVLHGPHHSLPLLPSARGRVVTVHDLTFDLLPGRYTPARRAYMRLATRLGLLRAQRVITPSRFVRELLISRHGVAPERVVAVPEAPPPGMARVQDEERLAAVRARYDLPERPYLLSVGTLEPGKNRETLFGMLALLQRRGLAASLVVVGGGGWRTEGMAAALRAHGVTEAVRFTGYVPDEDLPALYTLAGAFVFPSLLEGFGLPPLEAMACGAPVVASRRPAMPEMLGEAALYAPARDAVAWADAVESVLTDEGLRERLVAAGARQAALYSWERAAVETIGVYREAVGAA